MIAVGALGWMASALYYKWIHRIKKTEKECSKIEGYIMPELTRINVTLQELTFSIAALNTSVAALTIAVNNLTIRVDNLTIRVDDLTAKVDNLTIRVDNLTVRVDNLSTSFNRLIVFLKGKFSDMDTSLFLTRSPIQLTDLAMRLLEKMGGKRYIDTHEHTLISELAKYQLKTALDVQIQAAVVILERAELDSFNTIKDFIFVNPIYKESTADGEEILIKLQLDSVSNIMGIYLRDIYLNKYPGLNPWKAPDLLPEG